MKGIVMEKIDRVICARMRAAAALLGMCLTLTTAFGAHAEDDMPMGGGGSGMGMGMGGGGNQAPAIASPEMQRKMEDLRHHSMVMEGIQDEKKLIDEMRKHMRMLDDMVAEMLKGQSNPGGMGGQQMNHM